MALSVFEDKSKEPTDGDLAGALGETHALWKELGDFVLQQYPEAAEEWNHSGKNSGWGFRLKDKKRVILYLTPGNGCFKASLVFGKKATREALAGDISDGIRKIIESARVYAEGRGVRIDVTGPGVVADIKKMIVIKIAN
jgi:hypothetical protein